MKKSVMAIIIIVLALGGIFLFTSGKNNDDTNKTTNTSTSTSSDTLDSESESETNQTNADASEVETKIEIKDFAFSPSTITIKKGSTITWTNKDNVAHTVTTEGTNPASFDSGLLNNGQTFSQTFDVVGTYAYMCTPHPNMKATVIVTE